MTTNSKPDVERINELGILLGYDVTRATLHLFAVLRGLELVRQEQSSFYAELAPESQAGTRGPLKPSYMDGYPLVFDPHHPLDDLEIGGAVEQSAYRAWIIGIFSRWETEFRPQLKKAMGPHGIPAEFNVMNDIRHIRNDLVHAHGRATAEHCGKCEVLRWFEPGQPMIFQMKHILDAVHQMGWFGFIAGLTSDGSRGASWGSASPDELRRRQPAPKIISFCPHILHHPDTNEIWVGASVIYDNGFHARSALPTGRQASEQADRELRSLLDQVRITEDGDLKGPVPWLSMSGRGTYLATVDDRMRQLHGGEPPEEVPLESLSGPWIKVLDSDRAE